MNHENSPSPRPAKKVKESASEAAERTRLIEALNVLLEAERAGTRVAISTGRDVKSDDLIKFLALLRRDEAHWCAMLTNHIERLLGAASLRCGDFYGKAMAVNDTLERLSFLNRGQGWVVRKLDELIPDVTDIDLSADLQKMRDSHVLNIAETSRIIEAASR